MRTSIRRAALFVSITFLASTASAQITSVPAPTPRDTPKPRSAAPAPRSPRGMLTLGGSTFPASNFTLGGTKSINAESASYSTALESKSGFGLSASAGFAVWRRLGVKGGFSTFSGPVAGKFQASVPHPFYFNKARTLSGETAGLKRQESAIDLHVATLISANPRVTMLLSAGPTFLSLQQGVATDFTYRDTYPYDTATLGSVSTGSVKSSKTTFGGSATLGLFLTKSVGLAAGVHFASAQVPIGSGSSTSVKVGGVRGIVSFAARF